MKVDKAMEEEISAGMELEEELTLRLRKAIGRVQPEYKTEQPGWGASQEGQGEPSKEMQQCWEAQWQEFPNTLQPIHTRWATSVMPEMAPWEDAKAFLASFEQVAKACRWPREEWAARLLPALSGEAEETFRTLETRDQEDYEKVKAAILRGDALRMEMQRQHFRQFCCPEVEDPRRIHSQLQELCHRWLKPERRSKEQILELLVLEQFLASLPPDLQNWIRAGGPDTCSQAVALMEDFLLNQKDAERGKWKQFQRPTKEECLGSLDAEGEPLAAAKDEICEEAQQNTEAEISPLGIGIQGPSCHASLLPSEGQDMDHTGVKEEPTDLKEPNLPLQIVKQSLSQPGQQTIMWQVLQEDGGSVSSLGDGKGRQVKMKKFQCGEDEPVQNPKTAPLMGQGKVLEAGEMCKEQCESKTEHRKQSVELEEECTELARDPTVAIYHHPKVPTRREMNMLSKYGQTYTYSADIDIIPNREDNNEYSISEENTCQNMFSDNHQQKSTEKFKCELPKDMSEAVLRRDWHNQTEENLSNPPECGNSVSYAKSLKRNQVIHNEGKPYECSHCRKCFSEREEWMKHQQLHTGDKRQECSEAEKIFTFREAMKHQEMRTLMKSYMCSQCGKSFSQRRNLENHQRTHTGVKPYKCSQCGKCFNQTRYLKIHQRIHTGEKPYKCSECGKRFIRGQCLKNHQRTHTGDKPYACSQCGRCFNQRRYLKNHLRIHSGLKPYKCSQCGKSFSQSGALMSHQRTHKEKIHTHVESVRNASNWEEM